MGVTVFKAVADSVTLNPVFPLTVVVEEKDEEL